MSQKIKKLLNLILCFVLTVGFAVVTPQAHADTLSDLNKQKEDIQKSINSNQQNMQSLQDMINSIDVQTTATQKEIDLTGRIINLKSKQISQTQEQIAQKNKELQIEKTNLYETLAVYYENQNNNQSILEILLGAESLSGAIDKAKYLEAIGGSLNDEINKINKIMADLQTQSQELANQKSELDKQKSDLTDQQRNLANQANAKKKFTFSSQY